MLIHLLRASLICATAAGLLFGLSISHSWQEPKASVSGQPGGNRQPVVVELFTSEGCSSCPPADALLKRLSELQPVNGVQVVALEEHVDYWNHQGWVDPFSSYAFSERQDDYARSLGTGNVYTPQLVVDGQFQLSGSRATEALNTIQKAATLPKLEVALNEVPSPNPKKLAVEVEVGNNGAIKPHAPIELWVAVTETGLQSDIKAGENSGETLKHAAVVRSLKKVETLQDPSGYKQRVELSVDSKWKKENLAVVVFAAEKNSHKIIGAGATTLHP